MVAIQLSISITVSDLTEILPTEIQYNCSLLLTVYLLKWRSCWW